MVPASHFSEGHIAVAVGEAARTARPHSSPKQAAAAAEEEEESALDTLRPAQHRPRSLEAPAVAAQFPAHQPLLELADAGTGKLVEALHRSGRPGQHTAAVDTDGVVELDRASSDRSTRL